MAADDRSQEWISPNHQLRLFSEKIDDVGYRLKLSGTGSATLTIVDEYFRSVEASWSPDSRYLAVTNWIGSNSAECMMIDMAQPEKPFDITTAVPTLIEDPARSHFYVSCEDWKSLTKIAVRVHGHTDDTPSHGFDYRFVFDVNTQKLISP